MNYRILLIHLNSQYSTNGINQVLLVSINTVSDPDFCDRMQIHHAEVKMM